MPTKAAKPVLLDRAMIGRSHEPAPVEPKAAPARDYGVPLNFRVKREFNMRFRMLAVRKGLKLHQLLERAVEVYIREEGET